MDDVRIEDLGAGGDGVAEGGAVFVPFTLPGERVALVRQGSRGTAREVLEPAPHRVAPPCPHFGRCGGCALQHGSDALLADWKRALVLRALASRGIDGVEVRPCLTSPPRSRRRITLSARRRRKGSLVGMHAVGSDEVVPLERCELADPALVGMIERLDPIATLAASRKGEAKITLVASEGGVDCAVSAAKPLDRAGLALASGAAVEADLARLAWNGETVVTLRPPVQVMGGAKVVPPPGGFLQATPQGEAALVEAVREAAGDAARIADLFAGCGTFALRLAERAEVTALEADGAALEALNAAWRRAEGLKRVTVERRNLFRRPLTPAELASFDAVVIDPPRAGARAQAEALAASAVPRIAAVSCNPATFARDARFLIDGGYRLDWVQPIDQFRWSPHVELAAAFSRS